MTRQKRLTYTGMGPDQILGLYPVDFIDCRIMGHDWPGRRDIGLVKWSYAGRGLIDRTVVCKRCGYMKVEHYNNHFDMVDTPHTYYPPGYLTAGTGLKKRDFRSHGYSVDFAAANNRGEVEPLEDEQTGSTSTP